MKKSTSYKEEIAKTRGKNGGYVTPEAKLLSSEFVANRNLPWPLSTE